MTQGKRAGSRKGARTKSGFQPALLVLALGVTLSVVAWGYLVWAAIDFGSSARSGDSTAWALLGLASIGAVACLFAGLMLVARLLRRLGITQAPAVTTAATGSPVVDPHNPERPAGGRRAAR